MDDEPGDQGRRAAERRKSKQPFAGEDRRKGERRSGKDRRSAPRNPSGT